MLTAKQFTRKVFELVKADHFLPVTEYNVYSTAETKCGVWTNGKPLYKKSISIGALPNGDKSVVHGISNLDRVVKIEGYSRVATYTIPIPFVPGKGTTDNLDRACVYVDETKIYIQTQKDMQTYTETYVTLYYTKTTDTATSPKVPYEPLHEWSTSEKLVGYWIDGKAVYEKTVSCGALPNNTTKQINHNISSLNQVLEIKGYGAISGGVSIVFPYINSTSYLNAYATSSVVGIETNSNMSTYTGYVTLRYTKTT